MRASKNAPPEILYMIFEDACHDYRDGEWASEDVPLQISISHVCRSWRSAAIGSPKLWSQYIYRNRKNFIRELDRLAHYLERSRNQPLVLSFRLEPYELSKKPVLRATRSLSVESRATSLVLKAMDHAGPWRQILVHIDGETEEKYPDPPQNILMLLRNISLPNLESFELATSERFARPEHISTLFDAQAGMAPKLHFLRMDHFSLLSFKPSQNITTLEIEWTSSRIHRTPILLALREVMAFPTLISLSILGVPSRMSPTSKYYEEVQPRISSLKHLRCSNSIVAPTLFFRMQYPHLESLTLKDLSISFIEWKFSSNNTASVLPALSTLAFVDCVLRNSAYFVKSLVSLTKNISHLYVFQGTLRTNPKWDFYPFMEEVLEACLKYRSTHCKNLVSVTLFSSREYTEWQEAGDIRSYRKIALEGPRRGSVRLPEYLANGYKSCNEKLWRELEDWGLIDLVSDQNLDAFLPPWPARTCGGYRGSVHGSGDPFYALLPAASGFNRCEGLSSSA